MEIERGIESIVLDYPQLLDLVRNAFPACKKIDKWELLSGGALNTTYKIQIDSDCYVLRIFARSRASCKTEKEIYQLIYKSVPIPKLIYISDNHKPWAYSISEFAFGMQLTEVAKEHTHNLSHQLGQILASIHAYKFPQAGLFGDGVAIGRAFPKGSSPYFEETFSILTKGKHIRNRLGTALADKMLSFIQKHKQFFPIVQNDICLVHSDFKPVNLLYSEGKVSVLDWEFAHAGMGILDFSILLRHRHQFPLELDSLKKGYENFGGTLPSDWLRSAYITDFVNIVTLMESPSETPQLFRQLKAKVETTMDNWNSLS